MDRSIPLSPYNLHYRCNNVTLRRLCPPRSGRITKNAIRDRWNKMLVANTISSRYSRLFRFFLSSPSRRFSSQIFQRWIGEEGGINVSFARYVATLLLFLLVSCKSINGRVLLEADYSQFVLFGGCTINSATHSTITQPKLRNNKSSLEPYRIDPQLPSISLDA